MTVLPSITCMCTDYCKDAHQRLDLAESGGSRIENVIGTKKKACT